MSNKRSGLCRDCVYFSDTVYAGCERLHECTYPGLGEIYVAGDAYCSVFEPKSDASARVEGAPVVGGAGASE